MGLFCITCTIVLAIFLPDMLCSGFPSKIMREALDESDERLFYGVGKNHLFVVEQESKDAREGDVWILRIILTKSFLSSEEEVNLLSKTLAETLNESISYGNGTHPQVTFDTCFDEVVLSVLFHKNKSFGTLDSHGMPMKGNEGQYVHVCSVFLIKNEGSTSTSRYSDSTDISLDMLIEKTFESEITIECDEFYGKVFFQESIFRHHILKNKTSLSFKTNGTFMPNEVFKVCLLSCIVCRCQHKFTLTRNYLHRSQINEPVNQNSMGYTWSTSIGVNALQIKWPKSSKEDIRCIDYSVHAISNYISNEEDIFYWKPSVNNTLEFTVLPTIQNILGIELWHFHLERRNFSYRTESVHNNAETFGTDLNCFDKLMPLLSNCVVSSKATECFTVKKDNQFVHQSKCYAFNQVTNKLTFEKEKYCCVVGCKCDDMSDQKYNFTSKYRGEFLKRLHTTQGYSSRKNNTICNRTLEKVDNFVHIIFKWGTSDFLSKADSRKDSHNHMSYWMKGFSDNYSMDRPKFNSINTDTSVSPTNSFLKDIHSTKRNRKKSQMNRNKEECDFVFHVFFSGNNTALNNYNRIFLKNSTRIGTCSVVTGADKDGLNLNYSGISLKQNVSLSSNNTSCLFMFQKGFVNFPSVCKVLGVLLLILQHESFTYLFLYASKDFDLHSVFRFTAKLDHFNNSTSTGYIDHTVHVLFVLEFILNEIILGYIWCLHFLSFFNDKLRRRRSIILKLLKSFDFKLQIKSMTLRVHVQYSPPKIETTEFSIQQTCSCVTDLNSIEDRIYEETYNTQENTCHCEENNSISPIYPSLPLSETEDDDNEDGNSYYAQSVENDKNSSKEKIETVQVCESNVINQYEYHTSLKKDINVKAVMHSDGYDFDHTYVKHQQCLLHTDRDDNETLLKTIESDSVDELLDCSLSGDFHDLKDLNITPRDGLETKECFNTKALSSTKIGEEMKRTLDYGLNSTEMIKANNVCDINHMYKPECLYSDFGDCNSSLDTLSSYDSNKMESKRNDSVVFSSWQSLPKSNGFENVDLYHCFIDIKQDKNELPKTPVQEIHATSTKNNIVTSSSKYKEQNWTFNTTSGYRNNIAQGVRKFLKKYRKRQRRRYLRRLRQCAQNVQCIKNDEIICNPVFSKETSSNTTDQIRLPQPESSPAQDYQNVMAGNQFSLYRSSDYESSLGTLSSIFNNISIQTLNENDGYQYEWIRLASFSNFSSETVHATRLARGGWYSYGNSDQTACFSCHRIHENWTQEDDPSGSVLHDPDCRFMLQISNNRPIPRESTIHRDLSSESLLNENITRDHTEPANQHMNSEDTSVLSETLSSQNTLPFTNASSEDRSETHLASQTLVAQAATSEETRETQLQALMRDPMGINFDRPKYPSYAILAVRVSSYSDWPTSMTQTPRDMALAGFFYAGHGDYTRCFFCGGGLRNWEAGDDPWVEHARWFSKCAFVRQNRGQQFIDLVLRRAAEMEQQENQHGAKEARIMNSAAVRSIKDMGYSEEKIKEAIDTIKSRLPRGKHKVSAQEILEVLFELADRSSRGVTRPSEPALQHTEPTVANQSYENQSSTNLPANTNAEGATSAVNNLTVNDLESLQRENTSLKDQIICKICMEKNVSIAFLPCGHLACCADCAPAMRKCPICREFVRGTVKTYLV